MADKDVLQGLRPMAWGLLCFPVTELRTSFEHDIAEHKTWGVDGANLEATGRGPIKIDAKIPFRINLFSGTGEDWNPSILYPDGFRQFLLEMAARSTQTLVHPELGPILAKPKSVNVTWDPSKRDGVDVEASWMATNEDPTTDPLASDSPIEIRVAALDIDISASRYDELKAIAPKLPKFTPDVLEIVRILTGRIDQVALLQHLTWGKLAAVAYRMEAVLESVDRAGSASPLMWSTKNAAVRMLGAAEKARERLSSGEKSLREYTVKADTTIAALAAELGTPPVVLMTINRGLGSKAVVSAGTVVRYAPTR